MPDLSKHAPKIENLFELKSGPAPEPIFETFENQYFCSKFQNLSKFGQALTFRKRGPNI